VFCERRLIELTQNSEHIHTLNISPKIVDLINIYRS